MHHRRGPSANGEAEVTIGGVLDDLERSIGRLQEVDLAAIGPDDQLPVVARIEVLRRRLDHATDKVVGHLDRSGAYARDGHRDARSALKHLGRLPGADAHRRTQTARALRRLPAVAAAYGRGDVPTAHVRAVARVAANPRVAHHLDAADPVFAELATIEPYDDFVAWLRAWEALADADGTERAAARSHRRRDFRLVRHPMSDSWVASGSCGALQGAAMKQILDRFEDAEFDADWAEARARHGGGTTADQLPRTPAQRRADALFAIFRRAASVAADRSPATPLVDVVVDLATFERAVQRAAGHPVEPPDPSAVDGFCRQTLDGTPLGDADVAAAALAGEVRRVVVDAASNVIDLGRRRRLFRGSSRDAALLQEAVRRRGGLSCAWHGCSAPRNRLHVDHRRPAARGGPTDVGNGDPYCAGHNLLKEHGFRPVRGPDGRWSVVRPDGEPVTPAA